VRCNFNDVSSVVRRTVWEQLPLERVVFGEDISFARSALEAGWKIVFEPESEVWHSHEYGLLSLYRRTRIDAEMNMSYLGRPCVDKYRHVWRMCWRAWKEDRRYLRQSGLPFLERLKWSAYSPFRRFAEYLGFWSGGRKAVRRGAAPGRRAEPARPVPVQPLKLLFVVHGFPPETWAGVEVLSLTLARALRRRNHEIVVFSRSPGKSSEKDRSLHQSEFDGFTVYRYVNHLAFAGVDETYRLESAEDAFEQILLKERPDVVHVFHMIHLSVGIIERCRANHVPCVVAVWDFWSRCSRVQLIRPDQTNCLIPPPGLGCAACVYERCGLIDPLARLDRLLGPLPQRWAQRVPQSKPPPGPGWQRVREDTASLLRRESCIRDALLAADRLVVASITLHRSLVELGIPPHKICVCQHGMATGWLGEAGPQPRLPRRPGESLRVGFVGSVVWYKGLLVAARAVAAMPVGSAHLHVYGDHLGAPDPTSQAQIREIVAQAARIAQGRISFHGRFAHDDLARIHASMDVLVVPSVWQEAYGLTVREAQLSGTPVIGSRIAGIAEGVRHGIDGLLFEPGDAEDLRRALEQLISDPMLGSRLAARAPRVRTDDEEAIETEWRYRQVIGKAGAATHG
jgi:glycosyltransferase involved in cell wall biosynthesis